MGGYIEHITALSLSQSPSRWAPPFFGVHYNGPALRFAHILRSFLNFSLSNPVLLLALSESNIAMSDLHMNAVELSGLDSKHNNDDTDLARLGKNPVLKVWHPTPFDK